MKLVFDLQALQTPGSRHRGIGRYSRSLMRSMIEQAGRHDIHILLNDAFPDSVADIMADFGACLDTRAFHFFPAAPCPVAEGHATNVWRARAAERLREAYIQQLQPDIVHVSSLFEGLYDNGITSCKTTTEYAAAVTLYDLIPYIRRDVYLENPAVRRWYLRKIEALRRADLSLAISDHSRAEAIDALQLDHGKVVAISGDADAHFVPTIMTPAQKQEFMTRMKLRRSFIMYTGGIDHRKNVEGLITSFARLPAGIRSAYHLVIVCSVSDADRQRLQSLAQKVGAAPDDIILTGFVSESDLTALYGTCHLFVFPSLHEGFGLPVLEAMRCGAPVIGANSSSIPEIIGLDEALFDPQSVNAIEAKLAQALTDETFRRHLMTHGEKQSKKFSWRDSGRKALDAFEELHAHRQAVARGLCPAAALSAKPRLAYISPLPPQRSGIADYSATLIPELSAYYDIELVGDVTETSDTWLDANMRLISVADFERSAASYDRILYHFGNSEFHKHMYRLLERYPGTVVLHDLFLSGYAHYMEVTGQIPNLFQQNLYQTHGYEGLIAFAKDGAEPAMWSHPANGAVLQQAQGLIFHSQTSLEQARAWLGNENGLATHIPLLREQPPALAKTDARKQLQIAPDMFMTCSFGMLGRTKCNTELLQAWLASDLAARQDNILVFVGECPEKSYEAELIGLVQKSGIDAARVKITGYVDTRTYRTYLAAADIGVQLRTRSRGETSAAIGDALVQGLPLILNAHGSAAEIPDDIVGKLPDTFTQQELIAALEGMRTSATWRQELSEKSARYGRELSPAKIARLYRDAIENFAANHPVAKQQALIDAIAAIPDAATEATDQDFGNIALAVVKTIPLPAPRQTLMDITALVAAPAAAPPTAQNALLALLNNAASTDRIEPVYYDGACFRYARQYTLNLLGLKNPGLNDAVADLRLQDTWLALAPHGDIPAGVQTRIRQLTAWNKPQPALPSGKKAA